MESRPGIARVESDRHQATRNKAVIRLGNGDISGKTTTTRPLNKENAVVVPCPSFNHPYSRAGRAGESQFPKTLSLIQAALSKQRRNVSIQRASGENSNFPDANSLSAIGDSRPDQNA